MHRLEHANLNVHDAQSIVRFICAAIPEFHIRGEGRDDRGRPWCHVGTDDHYLALTSVGASVDRTPYGTTVGLNHLGYEVDDLDALEARMARAGFHPNLRIDGHPARRRIYFHDPEGNDWEFVEYASTDPAKRNAYD